MRHAIYLFIPITLIAAGCVSHSDTSSTPQTSTHPQPCALNAGGHDVLLLTAPADTVITSSNGFLHLKSRDGEVEFWVVNNARTIEDGVKRIDKEIISEFKDFAPAKSADITIAGAAAKRIQGTGTEADDGDPGDADVVVFQLGGNIFIACTHGENLSSAARAWMTSLLQTARKP